MNSSMIPDIPRYYTALAEWLACLVYLSQSPLRLRGWKLGAVCAGMLVVQTAFLELTGDLSLVWWMPCMVGAVGIMLLFLSLCCNMSLRNVGYVTIRAFILAEFAAALEWQLYIYGALRAGREKGTLRLLFLVGVYTVVFGFLYYLENRRRNYNLRMQITAGEMWGAVAIGVSAFLMSNLSYAYSNTPFSSDFITDIFNTRTMVDLGGLAILYAYHVQRGELHMQYELDSIQNVLQNQYAQYRQSRETIELIDQKYHDLKHQIMALRVENDPERRDQWLDEMEADIRTYEAQNKTGNPVLDTVLTSKSLYCQKHGINLTCVADGTVLDFMDVRDLCTIFGNALDNAIECELTIPDRDKRLIHLTVARQKGFALVRLENYCEKHLEFEDGMPVTTKGDRRYHGFGLKSIRYTAGKYNGTVTVNSEENWFELKILIPLSTV